MASTRTSDYVDDERSTGELVTDMSRLVSTLVRQEVDLAKAELVEKSRKAGAGAGLLAGAAIAALLTLGSLTAMLVLVLDLGLPAWAAALIVTTLWAAVAAGLAVYGRDKLRGLGRPIPEKTVDSVKEDVRWLKDRT